ncbi:Sterol regulatory element-binding protein 1 [Sphaceloma murrayae]|uniref:Sterol regulatory element-binding protein 1 n=1 Tax=Sphaceloma murrayae TaxID=2082308 RepID=A0A2K1QG28_9PEZI|nr:Sterol regulatory element-binding protein 1 [Sphaceloma murrayae]
MVPQDLDFSTILALDDMDGAAFQLPDLDSTSAPPQFNVQHPNTPFNGDISGLQNRTAQHDFADTTWDMPMDMDTVDVLGSHQSSQENLQTFQQQMDQPLWNTPSQQHAQGAHVGNMVYRHPTQVPPTPNSYELHGADAAQYQQQMAQRRAFVEQQIQVQMQMGQGKRDNSFTPLVSPAVTPQDTTFHHIDYGNSAAYFSPLTSPALQAQNAAQQYRSSNPRKTRPSTAHSSAATSPVTNGPDVDMYNGSAATAPDRARKSTRKTNGPRSVGSRSGVRSSPVTKPQKRKSAALSTSLSNAELGALLQEPQAQVVNSLKTSTNSTDGSGAGSISPEPLSEALMGPPPRPGSGSNFQSPVIFAQSHHPQLQLKDSTAPATPASLMSIDNPRNTANGKTPLTGSGRTVPLASLDSAGLDDFALPPSVANNTAIDSANATPRITAARKTPKFGPLSSAGGRTSATSSPAISAITSPSSAATPQFPKDARSRSSKKRSSVSGGSQMVSPALRPKISPSIKPLLPDGATQEQTQAFLLASKSNYTHLLEGTLLPGVSYPESLSSGLTSKRTSHKIAEQGRRNRINEALKEMQALLPPPIFRNKSVSQSEGEGGDGEDEDGNTKAGAKKDKDGETKGAPAKAKAKDTAQGAAAAEAKAANSKAATVESAIVYIKTLQQERVVLAEGLKEREREVNELRRRLKEVEVGNGEEKEDGKKVNGDGEEMKTDSSS